MTRFTITTALVLLLAVVTVSAMQPVSQDDDGFSTNEARERLNDNDTEADREDEADRIEDGLEDDRFGQGRFEADEEFDDRDFDEDELDRLDADEEEFDDDAFDDREDGDFDDDEDESDEYRQDDDDREDRFERDEFDDELEFSEDQIRLTGWIGVEIGPLDPAVAAHVSLEEGQGLMVYDVLDGSPAATAGIQPFDIVISLAGQPLADFAQLRQQVEQAKDGELTVEILRKGTRQNVQLKPGERPWNPDVFMPGSVQIPDDVEVTINKQGSGPVTVSIRQGDQSWTASTEEEFEQLPEHVVMWLFETMNDFMPFNEEEEWSEDWRDEDSFYPMSEFEDEGRFGRRGFQEEEIHEDPFEQRLDHLEQKIDRVLQQLEATH